MADHKSQKKGNDKLEMLTEYIEGDFRPLSRKYGELRRRLGERVTSKLITAIPFRDRFFTDMVQGMLVEAMKNKPDQDQSRPIQEAFEYLELYCLNLIHYYWKPEISKLKRYTGIYRTKLLAVLPDVDNFIEKLGYTESAEDPELYRLTQYINRNVLRQMALDCFIAQEHCKFLARVTNVVQERSHHRLGWREVVDPVGEMVEDVDEYVWFVLSLHESGAKSLSNMTNDNMQDVENEALY